MVIIYALTLTGILGIAGLLIYSLIIGYTVLVLLQENRDPEITVAWILVIVALPILGLSIYLNFGRNFRKVKIFSRKGLTDLERMEQISLNQIKDLSGITDESGPIPSQKLHIIKLLLNNSKALLTSNNTVEILNNGKAKFDALIEDMLQAQHHIHLEYYVYEEDEIGKKIRDILVEKARQGLEIRLIIDAIGCWGLSKSFLKTLKKAGVKVGVFMPVRFPLVANKINYRNHRKIVVIDGKKAYVGGLNIADRYIHGTDKLGIWRDTHLKITGDAVQSLQTIFITDWYFITKDYLQGSGYFPKSQVQNTLWVQITVSGPDSDWSSIMQAYFTAITTAEHYIYISTPYFMPNESILTALKTAALSGVDVKLILPSKSDITTHLYGSMSYVEELLQAGVHVYLYEKGFNHGKVMMVDGLFTTVGTANMDSRSFDKNFEVNALIYDQETVKEMEESFLEDIKDSKEVVLSEFMKRSRSTRIKESLARVLGPIY